jgi:hypothetical protein
MGNTGAMAGVSSSIFSPPADLHLVKVAFHLIIAA